MNLYDGKAALWLPGRRWFGTRARRATLAAYHVDVSGTLAPQALCAPLTVRENLKGELQC